MRFSCLCLNVGVARPLYNVQYILHLCCVCAWCMSINRFDAQNCSTVKKQMLYVYKAEAHIDKQQKYVWNRNCFILKWMIASIERTVERKSTEFTEHTHTKCMINWHFYSFFTIVLLFYDELNRREKLYVHLRVSLFLSLSLYLSSGIYQTYIETRTVNSRFSSPFYFPWVIADSIWFI